MPWSLKRFYGSGDLHFITGSCYQRQPLLNSAKRRDLFLSVLERMRHRYCFVVVGYVVMPEHFHLLLSEPEMGNPSIVMQAVKLGFARRVMTEFGQEPPVWQCRFYDFNVWSKHKRVEKLRYIHNNPVRRGLVEEPAQWRWSSFRTYAHREAGLVRVNDWTVLKMKIRGA